MVSYVIENGGVRPLVQSCFITVSSIDGAAQSNLSTHVGQVVGWAYVWSLLHFSSIVDLVVTSDLTFIPPALHSYKAFIPGHIVDTGWGSLAIIKA